jgi:hypothetical protein
VARVGPFLSVLLILALEPFAQHGFQELSRNEAALPCTCIGPERARLYVVYLHGRDTYGPSWTEIRNRQELRGISQLLQARIALPRTRSSWLPHRELGDTVRQITLAAATCFPRGQRFVVLGFSDGANAANELFLKCRTDVASRIISVGSSEGIVDPSARFSECGEIAFIAGRHEPGYDATELLARQLAGRGAKVRFYEHAGPHEVPFAETALALHTLNQ